MRVRGWKTFFVTQSRGSVIMSAEQAGGHVVAASPALAGTGIRRTGAAGPHVVVEHSVAFGAGIHAAGKARIVTGTRRPEVGSVGTLLDQAITAPGFTRAARPPRRTRTVLRHRRPGKADNTEDRGRQVTGFHRLTPLCLRKDFFNQSSVGPQVSCEIPSRRPTKLPRGIATCRGRREVRNDRRTGRTTR